MPETKGISAWPETPEPSGSIGVETEGKGETPGTGGKKSTVAPAGGSTVVRQHPAGGYTHAVPAGGTCRVYVGWWRTRRGAQRALGGAS